MTGEVVASDQQSHSLAQRIGVEALIEATGESLATSAPKDATISLRAARFNVAAKAAAPVTQGVADGR
ncbi:hypothetical protein JRI60_00820 [Archangium violaceum]|uniref:hypothetical protein n=1 Tax=Archangium violaceum TaxID=83451 RepID=UPI0019519555|nr:hypothetical protein [Archangium violaceum]QRN97665.1 hypothetical protein JRI60_00820 [Archangium violaceum]